MYIHSQGSILWLNVNSIARIRCAVAESRDVCTARGPKGERAYSSGQERDCRGPPRRRTVTSTRCTTKAFCSEETTCRAHNSRRLVTSSSGTAALFGPQSDLALPVAYRVRAHDARGTPISVLALYLQPPLALLI
jgi:hypothetical protein